MDSTIVFIHGLGCSRDHFKYQVEHFENNYNIVNIALPGHRYSEISYIFDIIEVAKSIYNVVKDIEGEIILIGHSAGVRVVLELNTLLYDKVSHLVLIDCTYIKDYPDFHISHYKNWSSNFCVPHYRSWITNFYNERLSFSDAELKREVFDDLWYVNEDIIKNFYFSIVIYDYYSIIKAIKLIKCPVLILQSHTLDDYFKLFSDLDNVKIQIFYNVGHWLHLQIPNEINNTIEDFLKTSS